MATHEQTLNKTNLRESVHTVDDLWNAIAAKAATPGHEFDLNKLGRGWAAVTGTTKIAQLKAEGVGTQLSLESAVE